MKPNLAYTIAFDEPDSGTLRQLAKLLVSSLRRSFFDGDILVIHNSPNPVFLMELAGVREIQMETPLLAGDELARYAMAFKPKVSEWIDTDLYSKILFLDADCIALRNIDHLLEPDADMIIQRERGRPIQEEVFSAYLTEQERAESKDWGINSGTWAVRASRYRELMGKWDDLQQQPADTPWTEQGAWNRVIIDSAGAGLVVRSFEANEIQFPLKQSIAWKRYMEAALLHLLGGKIEEKLKFSFGVYMQQYFHDDKATLLNILDM